MGKVFMGLGVVAALMVGTVSAHAATISTQFNTSDGFITGDFADISLISQGFTVTFSGGQQQQGFDLQSYNVNPAGYLFINGNFNGATGDGVNDDTGRIDFNMGVTRVSFFGANRGIGAAVKINVFGTDDTTLLGSVDITQTSNQGSDGAMATILTSAAFGGLIGSIGIDLPGPAGMPPYVLAIDTFEATSVPEPAALAFVGLGLAGVGFLRRQRR